MRFYSLSILGLASTEGVDGLPNGTKLSPYLPSDHYDFTLAPKSVGIAHVVLNQVYLSFGPYSLNS
jgi:hypothetical protein